MDIGSLLKGFSRPPNVEHPTISVLRTDLVDGIAPASIDLASADDCVAFSSTEWLRVWYVRDWPRTLGYKNWLDVLRFPADLRASLFMEPYAPGVVIKELERQEVAIQAGRYVRFQQKRDPSPSEDQKLREIREERQLIEINGDPFYYRTLALGLFASSREQLEQLSAEVES